MFTNKQIAKLYWPILVEQFLTTLVGIVNTIMVSGIGDFAVAAVNLVDTINIVIVNALMAVATGAAVVVSQQFGRKQYSEANHFARQGLLIAVGLAVVICAAFLTCGEHIISALFGKAEDRILTNASVYLVASAISYPFLAVFASSASVMRVTGDSKTPMSIAFAVNIVNTILGAVFIFVLKFGVLGAGIALLSARIVGAVLGIIALRNPRYLVNFAQIDKKLISQFVRPILKIAIPSGVDQIILNGSKLFVQVFIVSMGTAMISANAIGSSILTFMVMTGVAMITTSTTIIGQTYGTGDIKQTKYYMKKLMFLSAIIQVVVMLLVLPFLNGIIALYNPSAEVAILTRQVLVICMITIPLFWSPSYQLAQSLRAVGDVNYTTIVSVSSMWLVRVGGAWLFGIHFGMGIMGVWVISIVDWIIRGAFFVPRAFVGEHWNKQKLVIQEGE
jgi:putative MATE family efflux protein